MLEATSCDISGNRAGDPCSGSEEGVAACAAREAMVACHSGKFERVACRGAKGCEMVGGQPLCDQSLAAPGDPCKLPSAKACSVDGQTVLACRAGSLQPLYSCRGQAGCQATGGKLSCDQSIARLNDACDPALQATLACTEDKTALLICQNQRFLPSEACKRGTRCTSTGQAISCTRP